MPDYQNGKIYKIISHNSDQDIYVGSTTQMLCKRLTGHVTNFKKNGPVSSKNVLRHGNYQILLIENYPCNTKEELTAREAYYVRQFNCVNKNVPGRTREEWYEDNKDKIAKYYEDNKDKIAERQKKYYEDNKDKIAKYYEDNKDKIAKYYEDNKDKKAKYREDNKDKIAERHKKYYEDNKDKIAKYYEDNKDKISERHKKYYEANKILCDCGCKVNRKYMNKHKNSNKHVKIVNNLKNDIETYLKQSDEELLKYKLRAIQMDEKFNSLCRQIELSL